MSTTRPPLPRQYWNPHLKSVLESAVLPQVKYQVLSCQGQDILVGRLKIETPTANGHAFILRRYDTGAVSLTTMFRAAFPNAPEQDEKTEVQWVKDNHNLAGNNGSSREPHITRLAGTWIDTGLALELGKAYDLGALIQRVVDSEPDPAANYRRSAKATQKEDAHPATTVPVKPPSKSLPTPSPTSTTANPSKRRKESSPVLSTPKPPPPRRSTRTKSPPPKSKPSSSIMATVAKSKKSTRRDSVTEPADPDTQTVEDVAATELFEQDIAEQKEMIEDLKAQRNASKRSTASPDKKGKAAKRIREEEEALQFEFKEPEIGERAIVTNKRVGLFREMETRRKSAAWGLGLFVFGAGAISLLPNFF